MAFYIDNKDWKKVIDYAQASYNEFKSEIGGFMVAKIDKDGDYIISKPEILKQTVTGGTTEMDKVAVADYYVKVCMEHGKDVRFIWWHSHADMGAFWSGTDTTTMKEYSSGDWSAFLVVNIRGEYKFRVCVWNPISAHEDTELTVLNGKTRTIPKTITAQVKKLCEKPEYKPTKWTGYNYRTVARNGNSLSTVQQYNLYDPDPMGIVTNHCAVVDTEKDDNPLHRSTTEIVTEWNDLYTEGAFTFKEWLKEVKRWNAVLKRKQASFLVKELTENELHLNAGFYTGYNAEDFIDYGEEHEPNIKV